MISPDERQAAATKKNPSADCSLPLEGANPTATQLNRASSLSPRSIAGAIKAKWDSLSLTRQFAVASLCVILIGMLATGSWVSGRIKFSVIYRSAADAALYMDNFVAPVAQELTYSKTLSAKAHKKLDKLMSVLIGRRVAEVRVWRLDGTILYSTTKNLIGKKYPITDKFKAAMAGTLGIELDGDPHDERQVLVSNDGPLLEIYAPVRSDLTRKVIAIAEFYTIESALAADLRRATALSWLFVGTVALAMVATLFLIVRSGSQTIDSQKKSLEAQVEELETLLTQNRELRQSLQRSRKRSAEINEQVLRRVGADLHDGPVQLVSLALLVLHSLQRADDDEARKQANTERVQSALADSLREMRDLSAGLTMPELAAASLADVIIAALESHIERTRTKVARELSTAPVNAPEFVKVCVYRFVQEALNNSFKHAGGVGQRVTLDVRGDDIEINVSDDGPGLCDGGSGKNKGMLGLLGMRDRIETIGGALEVNSSAAGCSLTARIDVRKALQLDSIDTGVTLGGA